MKAPDFYVVLWRSPRGRVEVQPYVYPEDSADALARQLADRFGGEAFTVPVTLAAAVIKD